MMFFILHSFVNLFAGGRSDSKSILFLLYLLVLVGFLFVSKRFVCKLPLWWGGISVGCLYLYGVISHLWTLSLYRLPLTSFVITGNNGEISSSSIFHIHEAKGIIGYVLSQFGVSTLSTTDAGGAYVHLLPAWWFVVGAIFLAMSLFFSLYYSGVFYQRYLLSQKKGLIAGMLLYAVASFSFVKTAIDGGLFTPSLLAVCIGLSFFYLYSKRKNIHLFALGIIILSIVCILFSLAFPSQPYVVVLMQAVSTVLLMGTLTFFVYSPSQKKYLGFFVVLLLCSWWVASDRDRAVFSYGQTRIEQGESFFSYSSTLHRVIKTIEQEKEGSTISSVAQSQRKNVSYAPMSIPGKTCFEFGQPQKVDLLLKTLVPFRSMNTPFVIMNVTASSQNRAWIDSVVTATVAPCTPEPLTIINDMITQQGISQYAIVNPLFYDESDIL